MIRDHILFFLFLIFIIMGREGRAGESSTYSFSWLDPDKEVYVLQNRKFRKKRSLFLNLGFGKDISESFVDSTQIQGRVGFFFKEDYGLGLLYSQNRGKDSDSAESAQDELLLPFRRTIKKYQGVMLLWAPFYSKANFFNKIFYYDFIIGVGYAELDDAHNRGALGGHDPTLPEDLESHNGPLLDLEMKFFITRYLSASINANAIYYKAGNRDEQKDFWYNQWDLTFSVGLTL